MKVNEFKKNALGKLAIQFTEFKGKKLIGLGVFFNAGEDKDDWRPATKDSISPAT